MKVLIHSGEHYRSPVVIEYESADSINEIKRRAQNECGMNFKTRGKKVWVSVIDSSEQIITYWQFNEYYN